MKKSALDQFDTNSAMFVVAHAARQHSRGRKPSMGFAGEQNPKKALAVAINFLDTLIVPMAEPRRLLADLENSPVDFIGQTPYFGRYLAHWLRDAEEMVPEGFIVACTLALHNLTVGVDGFSNKPITNSLVGQPPTLYMMLYGMVPVIARAIFPTEFANEVSRLQEEIFADLDRVTSD